MLRYLKLQNFRLHEDTELHFQDDEQLIVVSGRNGAGKSTVVEGIFFALYGESRIGRRGLAKLVRRGAEIEGLAVIAEFDVASTTYRVERRRVGDVSSAVLWADGEPIAESANHVTAEISRILGMDSVGFRTAALARQKELEGLTSMDKTERKRVLTKLLRIDQVASAATDTQKEYRSAANALGALGPPPDIAGLNTELTEAEKAAGDAEANLSKAVERVEKMKADLVLSEGVELEWRETQDRANRAKGRAEAARNTWATKKAELAEVPLTTPTAYEGRHGSEIRDDIAEVGVELGRAELARESANTRSMLEEEMEQILGKASSYESELASLQKTQGRDLTGQVLSAEKACSEVDDAHSVAVVALAEIRTERRAASVRLDKTHELGNACDSCGQDITDEHLAEILETLTTEAQRLARTETEQTTLVESLTLKREQSAELLRDVKQRADAASDAAIRLLTVEDKLEKLESKTTLYRKRIDALVTEFVDVEAIQARKVALEAEYIAYEQAEVLREQAEAAQDVARRLISEVEQAAEDVAQADAVVGDLLPGKTLVDAWKSRRNQIDVLRDLEGCQGERMAAHAQATTHLQGVKARLEQASVAAQRHEKYGAEARIAAGAKEVLRELHARLSAQLRPELEGAIADILSRLSESRFERVQLSEEFEVRVWDAGDWRSLSDLSGGEQDLVALATRLALAQVVTNRSGTDAFGLLVLDECVGSQDSGRREAILGLLREMRGSYKQIILLSHVVGIENAADRVIEINTADATATV